MSIPGFWTKFRVEIFCAILEEKKVFLQVQQNAGEYLIA